DPARELAGLEHLMHQTLDELAVALRWQPVILVLVPAGVVDERPARGCLDVLELPDLPMECHMRQLESEVHAGPVDDLVPAVDAALAIGGVVSAQPDAAGGERGVGPAPVLLAAGVEHRRGRALEPPGVLSRGLLEP